VCRDRDVSCPSRVPDFDILYLIIISKVRVLHPPRLGKISSSRFLRGDEDISFSSQIPIPGFALDRD
jgi:hypothetical protein